MILKILSVFLLMQIVFAEKFYEEFKVYDIKLQKQEDFKFLVQLEQHGSSRGLDFWSLHNDLNELARVMVKPSEQEFFEDSLKKQHLYYEVVIGDVQGIVDQELKEHKELLSLRRTPGVITFDRYYQHEEINKYLDEIEKNYQSNPLVKVKSVGKSFEGREIKTITITNGDGKKKNSVFIDAGIHAREWIAPATALYLVEQLLDSNSSYSKILDQMDIVIMPVVNPDGYEYTFTRQRFWRKTRSKKSVTQCVGTDANRNFDFHWHEVGSSNNQCSETFHGQNAFSEVEALHVSEVMHELKGSCKFYLTLHSYGKYILYSWGHTNDLPETWKDLDEVAKVGADAIQQSTGSRYKYGSTSRVLYQAAGNSLDYAFAVTDVPISFVMELPGGGNFGFDLPARDIDKTVKESAVGIFAMIERVNDKYPNLN